jgi:predicted NUDIX family NTP pyrophosphohydrolase
MARHAGLPPEDIIRAPGGGRTCPVTSESELTAGLVVYRMRNGPDILLTHPGGPFWSNRNDNGAWSIPWGTAQPGDLLAGARRQFTADTGLVADGTFTPLDPVADKSGKPLHAFAVDADLALENFRGNTFSLEWPLGSGQQQTFPEIDRIAYFPLSAALRKMLPYQWPLLLELSERMGWRIRRAQRRG